MGMVQNWHKDQLSHLLQGWELQEVASRAVSHELVHTVWHPKHGRTSERLGVNGCTVQCYDY